MRAFSKIKIGSAGTDVSILQALLRAMQYVGADGKPLEVDGVCGDNTVHAINEFQEKQRAYGFEVGTNGKNDGTFGTECWNRILGV